MPPLRLPADATNKTQNICLQLIFRMNGRSHAKNNDTCNSGESGGGTCHPYAFLRMRQTNHRLSACRSSLISGMNERSYAIRNDAIVVKVAGMNW